MVGDHVFVFYRLRAHHVLYVNRFVAVCEQVCSSVSSIVCGVVKHPYYMQSMRQVVCIVDMRGLHSVQGLVNRVHC